MVVPTESKYLFFIERKVLTSWNVNSPSKGSAGLLTKSLNHSTAGPITTWQDTLKSWYIRTEIPEYSRLKRDKTSGEGIFMRSGYIPDSRGLQKSENQMSRKSTLQLPVPPDHEMRYG
jgi:hypothetical protein